MIKQIIEDLYLKSKFVENETKEVLSFYKDNIEYIQIYRKRVLEV